MRPGWARGWRVLGPALVLAVSSFPGAQAEAAPPEPMRPPSEPGPGEGLQLNGSEVDAESTVLAQVLPQFSEVTVFSGLSLPTVVRFSSDGRIFVAEKAGVVKAFDGLSATAVQVSNVSGSVYGWWDRGLLGMALDPNFPTEPWVYLFYTVDTQGYNDACPTPPGPTSDGCLANGRVSRIQVNASNQQVGSEQVLLDGFWCQQYPSHSVGQLEFGPDGALYVSAGDGASFTFTDYGQGGGSLPLTPTPANPCGDPPVPVGGAQTPPTAEGGALRSQDLRSAGDPVSFDGAVLRIDPDTGQAFPGNPLAGGDPGDDRVVAYGFRNPFRHTFRPATNELWVGDVGWGIWEEIDRIPDVTSVRNFGWPCYEGSPRQGGYDGANLNVCENLYAVSGAVTGPYFAWDHNASLAGCPGGGSSVSGLAFYEGGPYPAEYDNSLFFADYSRGCIWVMFPGGGGLPNPSNIALFASAAPSVHLEIGPNGDLFSVDHLGGAVRRYVFVGSNTPPTASATANSTSGVVPLTVSFDGSGSTDPDSDPLGYAWDLDGDGQRDDSTAIAPQYTYTTPGSYNVTLEVFDGRGGTDTDQVVITVSGASPGDGYLQLPGLAGTYVSAPDRTTLDITGDLDLRAQVAVNDWTPTQVLNFVSKWGGIAKEQYYLGLDPDGSLRVVWHTGSAFRVEVSSPLAVADGTRLWVRATLDVDNGAGQHVVTFFTSTNGISWAQHGAALVRSGTTTIKTTDALAELGARDQGAFGVWSGRLYNAEIRNGINGTVVAGPDFRSTTELISTPPDYSRWQDPVGNPWTVQGSGWSYIPPGGPPNQPPTATILTPVAGTTWRVGTVVSFSGQGTDPEEGTLPASALNWQLTLQHCPSTCHPHPLGEVSGSFTAPDHDYPSYLELTLTVTDSGGATGTSTRRLDPETVVLTFNTSPTGLSLAVGASSQATPFSRTVIIGSINSVSAPSPQTQGATIYLFSSWSDGGAQSHDITAPSASTTYGATYTAAPPSDGYLQLPGRAGTYVSAPDRPNFDITGDLDIRADVALDNWSTSSARLVTRLGDAYELRLDGTTRGLRLAWYDAGGRLRSRNSTTALPVTNGQRLQVRAVLDVNNPSGGHTVTFYYRTVTNQPLSSESGWTQLGNLVDRPKTTSVRAGSSAVVLGSAIGGSSSFWSGRYFQALILSGIGGTAVANPDFRTTTQLISTPPDYSRWQDSTANDWSIVGSGWTYLTG